MNKLNLSRFPRNISQSVWVFLILLLSIVAIGKLQEPQLKKLKSDLPSSLTELKRQEDGEKARLNLWQKAPTFGFDNLLASWVFLEFIQYFGDEKVRKLTGYNISPNYFAVILDRDPRFLDAYFYLSTSVSIFAGKPEESIALMNEQLNSNLISPKVPPRAYYIWRYKAIDELLFLGDGKLAKKSFEKAAEWAKSYDDPESQNVASVSQATADFLAKNPSSKIAQVSAWEMVLRNAADRASCDRAISNIERLGGKVIKTLGEDCNNFPVEPPKED
ncbi:MAG: hypothetical protein KME17_12125 [Cyanosarcina radialis HA8281-LM2]|jgi:hypothetical protein|nr:hypothetical protein [Cyanosarcina radialis HA8281-LM2]